MGELETLPLFPLGVVLFPGAPLPLRIFENRYKIMIGECIEMKQPFGVVLIKEGREVGGTARPHRVGTTARILKAEPSGQAMHRIQTVGERRFRILNIVDGTPYLKAEVEYLEEMDSDDVGDLAQKVSDCLSEYLQLVVSFKKGWIQTVDAPQEPRALSYAASQAVTYPPMVGQYLLQIPSVKERLERVLPLLEERKSLLKDEMGKQKRFRERMN
jgi:Lon protease-like protein